MGRKKAVVSVDALDHAVSVGTLTELGTAIETRVQGAGTASLHHWPRPAGKGWERTVCGPDDLREARRRLEGATVETISKCVCGGQMRGIFHDGDGLHLLELRCSQCGASFWPKAGDGSVGGTMKLRASFDNAAHERRRREGPRRLKVAQEAAQRIAARRAIEGDQV